MSMTDLYYPGAIEIAMANATRERPRKEQPMGRTSYIEQRKEAEARDQQVEDMALLIRQLAYALNRHAPEHSLTFKAKDYLTRHGLQGSLLRDEPEL